MVFKVTEDKAYSLAISFNLQFTGALFLPTLFVVVSTALSFNLKLCFAAQMVVFSHR